MVMVPGPELGDRPVIATAPPLHGKWFLTVAILALLVSSWVCSLPFQWDDYNEIPKSSRRLEHLAHRLGFEGELLKDPRSEALFRPVVWSMWSVELELSGDAAEPALFHCVSLVLHALVSLGLVLLLSVLVDRRAALAGACWFAVSPAAQQAVTWIAARGDLVVALGGTLGAWLALGAAIRDRDHPPGPSSTSALPRLFLAGCCLALALCGKASGISLAALVVLVTAVTLRGSVPGKVKRLAVLTAPVVVALVARTVATGGLVPEHPERDTFALADEASARFLTSSLHLLAPRTATAGPLIDLAAIIAASISAALALVAIVKRPRLTLAASLVAAALFFQSVLMGPSDRHYYAPKVVIAVIIGLGAASLGATRTPPLLRRSLLLLLLIALGVLHYHRARHDAGEGARQADAIETLRVLSRTKPPTAASVWMPLNTVRPRNHLKPAAFKPPFQQKAQTLIIDSSASHGLRSDRIRLHPGPIARFVYDADGLRTTGPVLPALTAERVSIDAASVRPGEAAAWVLTPPVVARGVHAITFAGDGLLGREMSLEATGGPVVRELEAGDEGAAVVIAGDLEILESPRITRIALMRGGTGSPAAPSPPVLVPARRLERLRALHPRGLVRVDAAAPPTFTVGRVPPGARIQLHVKAQFGRWKEIRCGLDREPPDGDRNVATGRPLLQTGQPAPSWSAFLSEHHKARVAKGFTRVRWYALATSARGTVLAQTAWTTFLIVH